MIRVLLCRFLSVHVYTYIICIYVHIHTYINTYIHTYIHQFIRSYPVGPPKLSQSPLLGPKHLFCCPSLSLQSRGHGRNSDTTDSTHPECRKKVKSVASTLGSKLHAAEGSLLQHIRWKFELEASFGGLSAFVCRPIPRAPVT